MNMTSAIMKSCNTYFYSMGRRIGYDKPSPLARANLDWVRNSNCLSHRNAMALPDSAWKMRKYDQEWTGIRHAECRDRPGLYHRKPVPTRSDVGAHRIGLNIQPEIIAQKTRPRLYPCPFPKNIWISCAKA
jgi:penicillin-binding protein 2